MKPEQKAFRPKYVPRAYLPPFAPIRKKINVAGVKELLEVYLKRFFPALFSKMVRKIKVAQVVYLKRLLAKSAVSILRQLTGFRQSLTTA